MGMYKLEKSQFKIRKKFAIVVSTMVAFIAISLFCLFVEIPVRGLDTANWKAYRNEEYGFEFKYPADKEIKIYKDRITLGNVFRRQFEGAQLEGISSFYVSFGSACEYKQDNDYIMDMRKILIGMNIGDVYIGNGMGGNYESILVKRKDKAFCFGGGERVSGKFKVDRSILSTFKFIN
jgi:hypothetical protein